VLISKEGESVIKLLHVGKISVFKLPSKQTTADASLTVLFKTSYYLSVVLFVTL